LPGLGIFAIIMGFPERNRVIIEGPHFLDVGPLGIVPYRTPRISK
jgi:hypothetical protein